MTAKLTKEQIKNLRDKYLEVDSKRLDLNAYIEEYNYTVSEQGSRVDEAQDEYNNAVQEWNDYLSELRDEVQEANEGNEAAIEWADTFCEAEYEDYYFSGYDELEEADIYNHLEHITDSPDGDNLSAV